MIADFNKSADLPNRQTGAIELMSKTPGEFAFMRPRGMFRERLKRMTKKQVMK